jgi:hypothetical protein
VGLEPDVLRFAQHLEARCRAREVLRARNTVDRLLNPLSCPYSIPVPSTLVNESSAPGTQGTLERGSSSASYLNRPRGGPRARTSSSPVDPWVYRPGHQGAAGSTADVDGAAALFGLPSVATLATAVGVLTDMLATLPSAPVCLRTMGGQASAHRGQPTPPLHGRPPGGSVAATCERRSTWFGARLPLLASRGSGPASSASGADARSDVL